MQNINNLHVHNRRNSLS